MWAQLGRLPPTLCPPLAGTRGPDISRGGRPDPAPSFPIPDGAPCSPPFPRTPFHQSCPPKGLDPRRAAQAQLGRSAHGAPPHFEAVASAEIAATGAFRRHGAPCRELLIYSPGEEKSKPSSS